MTIYKVKYDQTMEQSKRVQQMEGKITKELEKLIDALKELRRSKSH